MATKSDNMRTVIERPYTRRELAKLLHRSTSMIDKMAARGVFVRVKAKGMKRGAGFTAASVRAYCEGRV